MVSQPGKVLPMLFGVSFIVCLYLVYVVRYGMMLLMSFQIIFCADGWCKCLVVIWMWFCHSCFVQNFKIFFQLHKSWRNVHECWSWSWNWSTQTLAFLSPIQKWVSSCDRTGGTGRPGTRRPNVLNPTQRHRCRDRSVRSRGCRLVDTDRSFYTATTDPAMERWDQDHRSRGTLC